MNKTVWLSALLGIGLAAGPALAGQDRGDRIDQRPDQRGERADTRLDRRGARISNRLENCPHAGTAGGRRRDG